MDITTDTATDQALDREITAVANEIARTDSKASLLLALDGVLVAAVATLGKAPAYALALAAIGTAAMVTASVLAVLVVKPRLDPTRCDGFSRWAVCPNPDQLLQALAHDIRPYRLYKLSVLCERKMRHLIWAARLNVVAVVTVAAAVLVSAT
ncbi:Pycsar system effector family protein [Kitasatospora sp. NPDC092948]|uniref:Pycsar system effector family protein n=1 Tax=Kitasatospora sp. NPDC092948 TaxID=3364088 RepID=UPI003818821A